MNVKIGIRDVGALLADSFRVYGYNFLKLVVIVGMLQVPIHALSTLMQYLMPVDYSVVETMFAFGYTMLATTISLIITVLLIGVAHRAVAELALYPDINIGRAYGEGWRKFPPLLGAMILKYLALGLMMFTLVGIPAAIYFGVRWSMVEQSLVIEGCGVTEAFSRSSQLVRDEWWRILGVLFLMGLIIMAISMAIEAPFYVSVVREMIADISRGITPEYTSPAWLVASIGGLLASLLVMPFQYIFTTLLYFDLRRRKEEFNHPVLAANLGMEDEYREYLDANPVTESPE